MYRKLKGGIDIPVFYPWMIHVMCFIIKTKYFYKSKIVEA